VAGTARDGEDAVAKARELRPDVLTLDINMPRMDGISALQLIRDGDLCPVIMLSSLTQIGAETTFECLELGAFDFVAKPGGTVSSNMGAVVNDLVSKIRAAAAAGTLHRVRRPRPVTVARGATPKLTSKANTGSVPSVAVAIGISTGGPATLLEVLPLLPAHLPANIFLVQHMPAAFLSSFARRLDEYCQIRVMEAKAGMRVEPGVCYVAPGGMHLCPHRRSSSEVVLRTPTQPETLFVPSVNVMMNAVREAYGSSTVGVLMTGIGDDGADAMVAIRRAGGITIAESEETAVVFGMPREAIQRGGAEIVAPHYEIAARIQQAVGRVAVCC